MGGWSALTEKSQKEQPSSSAFDPENFGPVVIIQLMRLYDVQMALLSCYDPEKAAMLAKMHEEGISFTPPPAYSEVMNEEDEESVE